MRIARPATLVLRIAVFVSGPAMAGAVGDALTEANDPVRRTSVVLVWVLWATALLGSLVAGSWGLTAVRLLAPAGVAAAIWAAVVDEPDPLALAATVTAAAVAGLAVTGEELIDASSYGPERRLPLRVPGPVLVGPLPLAATLAVAGPVAGVLWLAAGSWVAGAVALVVGGALAVLAVRALHRLALRWLVLVPGGVVIHDPMSTVDAVLCRRDTVASIGAAPVGTDAVDLTQGALGAPLEIRLRAPLGYVPVVGRRHANRLEVAEAFLVAPTRPGRALVELRDHGLVVGAPA